MVRVAKPEWFSGSQTNWERKFKKTGRKRKRGIQFKLSNPNAFVRKTPGNEDVADVQQAGEEAPQEDVVAEPEPVLMAAPPPIDLIPEVPVDAAPQPIPDAPQVPDENPPSEEPVGDVTSNDITSLMEVFDGLELDGLADREVMEHLMPMADAPVIEPVPIPLPANAASLIPPLRISNISGNRRSARLARRSVGKQ